MVLRSHERTALLQHSQTWGNKDDLFIHKGLKFSLLYFFLHGKEVQWLVRWLVVELENRVGKAWDLENQVSFLWFPLESLHSNPYITLNLKLSPCSLGQSLITAFLLILRFSKTTWAMELLAKSRAPSNNYPNKGKQTHTHRLLIEIGNNILPGKRQWGAGARVAKGFTIAMLQSNSE